MAEPDRPSVHAAGVVVVRPGPEVLLVHRPRYDDWSFPKGKLDPGEHVTAAAVREAHEETGVRVRLGPRVASQHYEVRGRDKQVDYWLAYAVGDDDVAGYVRPGEIDEACWLPVARARAALTYAEDRRVLDGAVPSEEPAGAATRALVVLRHGDAEKRTQWSGPDPRRPLRGSGQAQAKALVPVLGAYGVTRVVTSSATRCRDTVAPYAGAAGVRLRTKKDLTEEGATAGSVARRVGRLLDRDEDAVLCTHRPVLPWVWRTLAVPPVALEPGGLLVVHHRAGQVVATECHDPG